MDKSNIYLPEGCREYANNMTLGDVKKAYANGDVVIGKVFSICSRKQKIYVLLGKNIVATLPFSEVTLYNFEYSKTKPELTIPLQIIGLKDKTICVKITKIIGSHIEISRKACMEEAFEYLKDKEIIPFYVVKSQGTRVYGDVGCGLQAKIDVYNLCKSRVFSVNEICDNGELIYVKVLDVLPSKHFNVSYKEAFPPYDPSTYHYGDKLIARINSDIDDVFCGYYVYINPQTSGILDYDYTTPDLKYGDVVECTVFGATKGGLRLRLNKIISRATQ